MPLSPPLRSLSWATDTQEEPPTRGTKSHTLTPFDSNDLILLLLLLLQNNIEPNNDLVSKATRIMRVVNGQS